MCVFGLKYFRLRQEVKHLYKLLTCACGFCLFGVLVSMIYIKFWGFSSVSPTIFLLCIRKLFYLNFDLFSDLFCFHTLSWPGHCGLFPSVWLLCFQLSSFLIPWSSSISLDVLLAFGSVLPDPFMGCPADSCWLSPVQSLVCCTPACSILLATFSILLTCSLLFIASHLTFHCLFLDAPLSSLLVLWAISVPSLPNTFS